LNNGFHKKEAHNMAEIKYEITEKIAVLSEKGNWTKEINKVSWNDRSAKFNRASKD